jgi:hypothetical protein
MAVSMEWRRILPWFPVLMLLLPAWPILAHGRPDLNSMPELMTNLVAPGGGVTRQAPVTDDNSETLPASSLVLVDQLGHVAQSAVTNFLDVNNVIPGGPRIEPWVNHLNVYVAPVPQSCMDAVVQQSIAFAIR